MEDWAKQDGAWDAAEGVADETSGGYLKLEDGDVYQMVFLRAPYAFKTVWIGGASGHSENYDEEKHDGMDVRGRFLFSVAFRSESSGLYKTALWETSATTFRTIQKALKKKGVKHAWEIEREGSGKKTEYTCIHDHALEGKELEHVESLDAPDPVAAVEQKASDVQPGAPTADLPEANDPFGEDIPF